MRVKRIFERERPAGVGRFMMEEMLDEKNDLKGFAPICSEKLYSVLEYREVIKEGICRDESRKIKGN